MTAIRRANGEGTIYRRKDGRYEAATYVPITSGGRKRLRIYGRTRREVHDKLVAAQRQAAQRIPIADTPRQLGDYLDYWLTYVVKKSRRPSTYQEYAWVARKYLKPELGAYRLDQLTVAHVQNWLDQKSAAGESAHGLWRLRKVLSAVLTRAQRDELVHRNVARLVELPNYHAEERTPWSVAEAKRFLAVATDHELYPAFVLLMLYGLRRGEVLGLRWCDVDFESGVLRVRNQLQRLGGKFIQGPTKTSAGQRDLPLLRLAREALLDQRAACQALWPDLPADGLVFVRILGQPLDPDSFRVTFQRLAKRYGIRVITIHDVRHTTATLLKDFGVPARDAQLILGHANITTTQQIYQHASLENRRAALERVQAGLRITADHKRSLELHNEPGRCRQVAVSGSRNVALMASVLMPSTSVNTGTRGRIRTYDLWLRKPNFFSLWERVTGIEVALSMWKSLWIIGAVAVSVAVRRKDDSSGVSLPEIAPTQTSLFGD